MTDFIRFPRTPHLAWLGEGDPRDDKVLASDEVRDLLVQDVIVEEKLDGANLGISVGADGSLRVQNRGSFLDLGSLHPQFRPLRHWLAVHQRPLSDRLADGQILFGEWCYAMHSIHYTRLPDWFIAFDVYDPPAGHFWSVPRRDALIHGLGIAGVPCLARGRFGRQALEGLLGSSRYSDGPAEGIYVRRDEGDHLERRAKLVRAEFTQAIGAHWSRGPVRPNQLATPETRRAAGR